jgi:hypothetical protein
MSRIEKNQPVVEEMEQMERRLVAATSRGRRRGWRLWLGIALLCAFAAMAGLALWVLAATGVMDVPAVSAWAYEPPVPTREVGRGIPLETVLRQQSLASSAVVTEETLTTELRDALQTSGQTFADADGAKSAVLGADGIELFLPLLDNESGSALVVGLRLSAEDGTLRASADRVVLGSWSVGSGLRDGLVNPALQGMLDAGVERAAGGLGITNVVVEDGQIRFVFETP